MRLNNGKIWTNSVLLSFANSKGSVGILPVYGLSRVFRWSSICSLSLLSHQSTVNSEIFAIILFSRIALKHIFDVEIRDSGVIYLF